MDEEKDYNSGPVDETDFFAEMRELFADDPAEAIARLEEAGYTEDDLEL